MRILLFIVLVILFKPAFSQSNVSRKIIDVHLHARTFDQYGNPPFPNPMTGKSPTWKTDREVVQRTLDTLKKYGIIKAVISGTLSRVEDFIKADPARFIPSLDYGNDAVDPLPDTTLFLNNFREGKFLVFGELALQYEGKKLTDPLLEPYLAICERLGIPVAVHTGLGAPNSPYTCCPGFRTSLGNPQLIEEVLINHPRLKVQLMHMGYPYIAETKAIMYMYPQVYADISLINWIFPPVEFYSYLQTMMNAGLGDRIMYGSDQMGWPDAIGLSIKNIEKAPFLSEKQKKDIFYNNAVRFYNIKNSKLF